MIKIKQLFCKHDYLVSGAHFSGIKNDDGKIVATICDKTLYACTKCYKEKSEKVLVPVSIKFVPKIGEDIGIPYPVDVRVHHGN